MGDELVRIDGKSISHMQFTEVMKLIKYRLSAVALTYRNQEATEKSRKNPTKTKFSLNLNRSANTKRSTTSDNFNGEVPQQRRKNILHRTRYLPITFGSNGDLQSVSHLTSSDERPRSNQPDKNLSLSYGLDEDRTPHRSLNKRLVLTFQTLEERMRRIRRQASTIKRFNPVAKVEINKSKTPVAENSTDSISRPRQRKKQQMYSSTENEEALKIDMRYFNQSFFIFVRPFDPDHPPYRIENRSIKHYGE